MDYDKNDNQGVRGGAGGGGKGNKITNKNYFDDKTRKERGKREEQMTRKFEENIE